MIELDALGHRGGYRSRSRVMVHDVAGFPVAGLSLVPAVFVRRAMAALRAAAPLPADDRVAAMVQAADLFRTARINGLAVTDYESTVSRVSGVPISVVRAATHKIADCLARTHHSVDLARPTGAVSDWRDPLTRAGRAVWVRRGGVFAVHAAGNHPATHALWPAALALGYRVAVRPSRREPFTPHRLVTALREAGFGMDHVVLLPTDHDGAGAILRDADLGMVYGGAAVVDRYGNSPRVLAQGPGRSKVLLTAEVDWREHLSTIVASVAQNGGTGCVNATGVYVAGDPAPVAAAIAAELAELPSLPADHDEAVLPVLPVDNARAIEKYLLDSAGAVGARCWLGGEGIVEELGDGSAVLRPAVHQLTRCDIPKALVELPFPCVWVAPWSPHDGIAPLRDTLVLTVLTTDAQLVRELVEEPTVSNVYVGDQPTSRVEPDLPHDGYLADFLMRTKAVIRS